MEKLLENFKVDYLYTLFLCLVLVFIISFIIWVIIEFVEFEFKIPDLISNIIMTIMVITAIIAIALYIIVGTTVDNKMVTLNTTKTMYNIEQYDDKLKFTKKPNIKHFVYKDEIIYNLKKEKITNNYYYNNKNVSEIKEEHYILEDTNNHKSFKLNKEQLKQLISYEKTENEKINIDDLKN